MSRHRHARTQNAPRRRTRQNHHPRRPHPAHARNQRQGFVLTSTIQFDRIIAATVKIHRLTRITRDAYITDSGAVDTLW